MLGELGVDLRLGDLEPGVDRAVGCLKRLGIRELAFAELDIPIELGQLDLTVDRGPIDLAAADLLFGEAVLAFGRQLGGVKANHDVVGSDSAAVRDAPTDLEGGGGPRSARSASYCAPPRGFPPL